MDGGAVLGSATVSGGIAPFTTKSLELGSHSFTAVYSGHGSFAASTTSIGPDSIIATVAGDGSSTYGGDGGPAIAATLYQPSGMAVDSTSNTFICDNNRVRMIDAATGVIRTIAGDGA